MYRLTCATKSGQSVGACSASVALVDGHMEPWWRSDICGLNKAFNGTFGACT